MTDSCGRTASTGTAPDTTRADDDAIRHTIAEAERHQNDVEPFLALHTDTTIIVNIAGRRVLGRDALRTAMTAALASPLADVTTKVEVVDLRFVGPDVAVVAASSGSPTGVTATGARPARPTSPRSAASPTWWCGRTQTGASPWRRPLPGRLTGKVG